MQKLQRDEVIEAIIKAHQESRRDLIRKYEYQHAKAMHQYHANIAKAVIVAVVLPFVGLLVLAALL